MTFQDCKTWDELNAQLRIANLVWRYLHGDAAPTETTKTKETK